MRELTVQEKGIVKKISDADNVYIGSLFSEIKSKCKIQCDFGKNEVKIYYLESKDEDTSKFQIPKLVIKEIFVISKLIQLLDSQGLIMTFERTLNKTLDDSYSIGNHDLKEPCSTYHFGDKGLKELFISYATLEIYPTEELKHFVKNSYKTRDIVYQNSTLTVSWVGICVAIILGLASYLRECMDTKNEIQIMNHRIDSIEKKNIIMDNYIDHLESDNCRLMIDTTFMKKEE